MKLQTGSRLNNKQTICAQLTPNGRGAIAVIALAGPNSTETLDLVFQPANGKLYSQLDTRSIVYGTWPSTGEDLVVFRRAADQYEIHCHGGRCASSAIIESLSAKGIKELSAAEYSRMLDDDWAVSTQFALSNTMTRRTAELVLNQCQLLPAAIHDIESLVQQQQTSLAIEKIEAMIAWANFGIHLTKPRTIVLCGRPNVGKSSLINALVGFQRAIVHDVAGTTRDVVSQSTAIDGWPVELKDTAGLREATDSIEAIGVEKAKSQIASADLVVAVFDLSSPWTRDNEDLIRDTKPHVIVFNKSDIANDDTNTPDGGNGKHPAGITTSVKTGDGIQELVKRLGAELVPALPNGDQPFPVSETQQKKLNEILEWLRSPESAAQPDFFACQ